MYIQIRIPNNASDGKQIRIHLRRSRKAELQVTQRDREPSVTSTNRESGSWITNAHQRLSKTWLYQCMYKARSIVIMLAYHLASTFALTLDLSENTIVDACCFQP